MGEINSGPMTHHNDGKIRRQTVARIESGSDPVTTASYYVNDRGIHFSSSHVGIEHDNVL